MRPIYFFMLSTGFSTFFIELLFYKGCNFVTTHLEAEESDYPKSGIISVDSVSEQISPIVFVLKREYIIYKISNNLALVEVNCRDCFGSSCGCELIDLRRYKGIKYIRIKYGIVEYKITGFRNNIFCAANLLVKTGKSVERED